MADNFIKRTLNFRNLYLLLLLVIAISLPLSKFLASAGQIFLVILWLAEGKFDEKWRRIKMRPALLIFTILFFVPVIGMVYTTDINFGLRDLKVKLPLFLLPLVLGSIKPLDNKEMRLVLGGFVLAVFIGALVSLSIMLGIGPSAYTNDRETILFISHIRFALMVVLAIFILFYYAFDPQSPRHYTFILVPCAFCLILFVFLLKSLTGVVILVIGGMILLWRWCRKQPDLILRWFVVVGLATLPVLAGFYLSSQIGRFYTIRDHTGTPDLATVNGNLYWHDSTDLMIENGYHVGYYQCQPEMRGAWNQISKMDFDGPDRKGQELKYTLMRYLTSLGSRKDSFGVSQLKPDDIKLIEDGHANCIYKQPKRFSVRIYETIWEIDQYRKGANPSGHSVIQRIEYLKTGWTIFRDHPWFGVGTGDTRQAFDRKYEETKSRLAPEWRLRAHNQFLTFLVAHGIVGFILIIFAIVVPAIVEKRKDIFFIIMFFLVTMLSMLNEDTLETQAGVAFFTMFYCLFVFADGTKEGLREVKRG
ncbi:MAG: O-antigen ligase family protein [Bacteroidales bacterium]|jgi:hypothetical protein